MANFVPPFRCFSGKKYLAAFFILEIVLIPICTNIFEKLSLDIIYDFCRS